jgi:hypothetical protein
MLVVDDPVICHGKQYLVASQPSSSGFCILRDVDGETFFAHESEIEDGLRAAVAWAYAEENSK